MRRTRNILMAVFCCSIALALITAILYESNILAAGSRAAREKEQFVALTLMELITICAIPLSLRLFRFRRIYDKINKDRYLRLALLRLCLLSVPLIINTLFYYIYLYTTFGYMAIILFLCLWFILPTKGRCINDVEK